MSTSDNTISVEEQFKVHTCEYGCRAVEDLLKSLTNDYGDGEPVEPTPRMLRAARVFVGQVVREWEGPEPSSEKRL